MDYLPTIGLEIHVELKTRTKMFCDSRNEPNETRPNTNICPICLGHPGTLPVINREAVRKLLQVGLALHGEIASSTFFERKNYFYPDLPKGYQISQYQQPLVKGGYLDIEAVTAEQGGKFPISNSKFQNNSKILNYKFLTRKVRIQRIHLEEDTGRLIHDPKTKTTLIDFNRAGIPLMELVTEPDIRNAEEARRFAEEFKLILQYLDASNADMEKGQMRIEANVSLAPTDSPTLGTKVELKNINSFRFVERAIDYEISRQAEILDRGGKIEQETRGWDEKTAATVSQRGKEESHDYRYFPEPDLPPLIVSDQEIEELRQTLTELPDEKRKRFVAEFGIDPKLAETLVSDRYLAVFFEDTSSELKEWLSSAGNDPNDRQTLTLAANYLTTDVTKLLVGTGVSIQNCRLTPENFAELITYLVEARISSRTAKEVLAESFRSGADPSVIIEERKLWQISESDELKAAVEKVVAANEKARADYQSGRIQALQFLVGQVMKEMRGANPEVVQKILKEKLKSD